MVVVFARALSQLVATCFWTLWGMYGTLPGAQLDQPRYTAPDESLHGELQNAAELLREGAEGKYRELTHAPSPLQLQAPGVCGDRDRRTD